MTSKKNPKPEGLSRPEKPSTAPPLAPGVAAEVRLADALARSLDAPRALPRLYVVTVHSAEPLRAPVVMPFPHEPTLQELEETLALRGAEAAPPWSIPSGERVRALLELEAKGWMRAGAGAPQVMERAFDRLEQRAADERFPSVEVRQEGHLVSFQIHTEGPAA